MFEYIDWFILQSNMLVEIPLYAVQLVSILICGGNSKCIDAADEFRYSSKSQSVQINLKVNSMP